MLPGCGRRFWRKESRKEFCLAVWEHGEPLRFEAKLPLYGQELSETITPVEAGLGFAVKPDKGEFIGREVLALQKKGKGAPRKLVGLEMTEREFRAPATLSIGEKKKSGKHHGNTVPHVKKEYRAGIDPFGICQNR